MATKMPPVRLPNVKERVKAIVGGSAGNMVEWYDWFVYSTFMSYFARVFFPSGDQVAELLSAAAVLALGFQLRPIGAWAMGVYADRKGRRAALMLSMSLMCAGSLMIVVVPGYRTAGLFGPFLLIFARLLQAVAIGGEYGTSGVYLSEIAEAGRRGFYCSFQYVALVLGQFLATLVLLALQRSLTNGELAGWGWRIPFAIESALALVVFLVRRGLPETRVFKKPKTGLIQTSSFFDLFSHHAKPAFVVGALTAGGTLAFYAYATYLPKFLVDVSGFDRNAATNIAAGGLCIFMLCQPVAGLLSDRFGHAPLMIGFGVLGLLCTCAIFWALATTVSVYAAFALSVAGLLIVTGYTSINVVAAAEMFPAYTRSLGVALPCALANTIFGGTAPWAAIYFRDKGNESWFIWYITAVIGLSLVVYAGTRDARRQRIGYRGMHRGS